MSILIFNIVLYPVLDYVVKKSPASQRAYRAGMLWAWWCGSDELTVFGASSVWGCLFVRVSHLPSLSGTALPRVVYGTMPRTST